MPAGFVKVLLPPYTWQTKLISMAALGAVFFFAGWTVHGWKKDAVQTHSIPKAFKTARSLQEKAGRIVNQAVKQKETVRIVYRNIKEKIYEQNDRSVCFTHDSLKLWNDAIGANPDTHRSESAAEIAATETPPGHDGEKGSPDSGTEIVATVEQVLSNAADNFETCNLNAIDHDKLIDVLNIYKGRMCVCN